MLIYIFIWYIFIYFFKKYLFVDKKKKKIAVVLGSGGHTYEMLEILKNIKKNIFFYFFYDKNDKLSKIKTKNKIKMKMKFIKIPNCRKINEYLIISFIKLLLYFVYCFFLTFPINVKIIIVNGPGICIPIVFSFFFQKIFFLKNIKIIYIESICRINSLSLSGKILYYISDIFIVFSKHLKQKYKKSKFYGYLF